MPLAFSLTYAAPEAVAAAAAGHRKVAVDSAVDMWALGVVAYELLTARRAFPKHLSHADIRAQVRFPSMLRPSSGNATLCRTWVAASQGAVSALAPWLASSTGVGRAAAAVGGPRRAAAQGGTAAHAAPVGDAAARARRGPPANRGAAPRVVECALRSDDGEHDQHGHRRILGLPFVPCRGLPRVLDAGLLPCASCGFAAVQLLLASMVAAGMKQHDVAATTL